MITIDEAQRLIARYARPLAARQVPLDEALGLVLAEAIASPVDSPPWDKSMVDGYAVVAADLAAGPVELDVNEQVLAGATPSRPVLPGTATRLMTGAPLPEGADAVVMVEDTQALPADAPVPRTVRVLRGGIAAGKHILRRGTSMRTGDTVLAAGAIIRPAELGLACELGLERLGAIPRPSVAVLATGDELVEPGEVPGPGQIRNSNGPMLLAAVRRQGATAIDLGIARDRIDDLRAAIERGLEADVLVLSGGVSAGVSDLVPQTLSEAGVEEVFHKVQLKPGKPLWFGVRGHSPRSTLVFGLPGNPVSSLVCFELFVRTAMQRLAGHAAVGPTTGHARLGHPHRQTGDRPTYFPAVVHQGPEGAVVETVAWQGSADLRGLVRANALAYFPAGDRQFEPGERLEVIWL